MITRRISSRPVGSLANGLWTCPSCTRSSLLQHTKKTPSSVRTTPSQQQTRNIHHVPPLAFDATFSAEGVPGLLSREGYSLAWTQYQTLLVRKLNELTAGEPIENTRPKDLAIMFARDPMNASLFNYASAAHNNHQFFQTLASSPQPLEKSPTLMQTLQKTFGSIETLKLTMLDTAAAMFGPGYVWLVWVRNADQSNSKIGGWRVLTTYLAGTPYTEAGYRAQGIDMASNNAASYEEYMRDQPVNDIGFFGRHSAQGKEEAKIPPGGTSVMPVLCVSTWEHSYIYDFGLSGKRQYLDKWWAAIDWGVVEASAPTEAKENSFRPSYSR